MQHLFITAYSQPFYMKYFIILHQNNVMKTDRREESKFDSENYVDNMYFYRKTLSRC